MNQNESYRIPYFRYYKTVLYLFLRLFGASSIQMGLVFEWVLYLTLRNLDTKFAGSSISFGPLFQFLDLGKDNEDPAFEQQEYLFKGKADNFRRLLSKDQFQT